VGPADSAGSHSLCPREASPDAYVAALDACPADAMAGWRLQSPPPFWSHARSPLRALLLAAGHGDPPRGGASCPVCPGSSGLCWSFRPPRAGTLALSSEACSQSISPTSCNRCSRTRCNRCHTPSWCQSRRRRQQVMPLPHPISWGSISHGIPLLSTKRIPDNTARSAIRGRPPFGLGRSDGKSGSMVAHSWSLTKSLLMAAIYHSVDRGAGSPIGPDGSTARAGVNA
jgi:hypothetical protein